MAQIVRPKSKLGPGFWPVTVFMTFLVAISDWWIVVTPFDSWLPAVAEPAPQIDQLFKFLSLVGSDIFIYVTGYILYFCVAFRARKNTPSDAIGIQIHDNVKLEFWWTVIPTVLVLVLAVFSVQIWMQLQNTQGDVLTMEAVGHQFEFEFRYPRLKHAVVNDMHIPVGTPVTLHVTSGDVIHSFWVPEVRIKADMVPGLINTLRFTPTKVGKYRIICTEFCGTLHGAMVANLYIDTQQDFGKWFAGQASAKAGMPGVDQGLASALAAGKVDQGKILFGQKCSACHSVGPFGQKIVGPGLANMMKDPAHPKLVDGDTPNPQNIAKILKNGYQGDLGVMPSAQANAISNADIANLTAYLVSLSGAQQ